MSHSPHNKDKNTKTKRGQSSITSLYAHYRHPQKHHKKRLKTTCNKGTLFAWKLSVFLSQMAQIRANTALPCSVKEELFLSLHYALDFDTQLAYIHVLKTTCNRAISSIVIEKYNFGNLSTRCFARFPITFW